MGPLPHLSLPSPLITWRPSPLTTLTPHVSHHQSRRGSHHLSPFTLRHPFTTHFSPTFPLSLSHPFLTPSPLHSLNCITPPLSLNQHHLYSVSPLVTHPFPPCPHHPYTPRRLPPPLTPHHRFTPPLRMAAINPLMNGNSRI